MKRKIGKALTRWAKRTRKNDYLFLEKHLRQVPQEAVVLNIGADGDYPDLVRRIGHDRGFTVKSSDIDAERNPDFVDDICNSRLPSDTFDVVVMASVLEHVQQPFEAAREIGRILKPGGSALLGVPFMFPIHARPHDYFRFTEYGLRHLFSHMEVAELERRDNWLEALILSAARIAYEGGKFSRIALLVVPICAILYPLASLAGSGPTFITSGYLLKAVKPRHSARSRQR